MVCRDFPREEQAVAHRLRSSRQARGGEAMDLSTDGSRGIPWIRGDLRLVFALRRKTVAAHNI
jgi:hypothetical protein